MLLYKNTYILATSKPRRKEVVVCTTPTGRTMGQSPWPVVQPVVFSQTPESGIYRIVLFSVHRDGNQGLENAIFRPWGTENKELCSLFSVPGDGHLAYSMLFYVPRDGNHGLENAICRPWKAENKELRSLFSIHGDGQLAYAVFWP